MLLAEIVRQFRIGHQVKPHQLHGSYSRGIPRTNSLTSARIHVNRIVPAHYGLTQAGLARGNPER
jgi:hypothetical protein